jgi:hypothetical protein
MCSRKNKNERKLIFCIEIHIKTSFIGDIQFLFILGGDDYPKWWSSTGRCRKNIGYIVHDLIMNGFVFHPNLMWSGGSHAEHHRWGCSQMAAVKKVPLRSVFSPFLPSARIRCKWTIPRHVLGAMLWMFWTYHSTLAISTHVR